MCCQRAGVLTLVAGQVPEKRPKRAPDPVVPVGYDYTVNHAGDTFNKCHKCKTRILEGELQLGKMVQPRAQHQLPSPGAVSVNGGRQIHWYQESCLLDADAAVLYKPSQIHGLAALPEAERRQITESLEQRSAVRVREKQMLSRLLYPNPVCMLTTPGHAATGGPNVMTISWLTPLNNSGAIVLSVNCKRHSARKLQACPEFVLNVPAHGFEDTVLAIGKYARIQQLYVNISHACFLKYG